MSHSSSHSTPKDVFLHLLATITLYMSVYSIIALLFACINVFLPDALGFWYSNELDTIRFAVAMLVVAFAVYMFLTVLINRDIAAQPGKTDIGARKWLTYLTIFLAALMIIIDVITLIYNFLNGELSARFFLKVLVVLVVASAVFGYYMWDIRRNGRGDRGTLRLIAWGSSAAIIASIVLSFVVAGSPWYQRNVRFDERRINDLQTIQSQTVEHWRQKGKLPASLNDLRDSISGFQAPVDPETGEAYEYRATAPLAFTLCATFKTESLPDQYKGSRMPSPYPAEPYQQNWGHKAGKACFDRTIDPQLYQQVQKPLMR
jgi:hypothetical protein